MTDFSKPVELTPWQNLKFGIFKIIILVISSTLVAIPFGLLAAEFARIYWSFAVPHLFPGAVKQGLIALEIPAKSLWPVTLFAAISIIYGQLAKRAEEQSKETVESGPY